MSILFSDFQRELLPDFSAARVLVVGDLMLDRYWSGETSRISPEAPVPVVRIKTQDERPGGAGNVALNLASLGSKTILMGLCGDDESGKILETKLNAAGVECHLEKTAVPTVTKLRVLSLHQQLIRLDFEQAFDKPIVEKLLPVFHQQLSNVDVIVLSDYSKGALQQAPAFIAMAREKKIPVMVDPKGLDFERYRGASLLTPNRREFEAVVGVCHDEAELVQKGQALIRDLNLEALLITRGEEGMTLILPEVGERHFPAQAREVYDVTGAGDTVIATLAAVYATSRDWVSAVHFANIAASIVVGKLGAATINVPELRRVAQTGYREKGMMTLEQLAIAMSDARACGEKMVMTCGCFDILHAGHVAYLEEAKSLGDRLIVAVNDDASVTRLKGLGRPVNTSARRMAVLSGLSAVDWVVSFSEDTPEQLVALLKPDIWVKGGDYEVDRLPETKIVQGYGGQVRILKFLEGCSTTAILERMEN